MFFVASKIFWIIASPIILLLILALAGTLLSWGRRRWIGRMLALAAILVLAAVAVTPIGVMLIAPLEDRFPRPPADFAAPYGLIILGGAVGDTLSRARGYVVFDEDGQRVVDAAILAKRYPEAKVVFTGGAGSLFASDSTEAREAEKLLIELGVDPSRIILEEKSRNTDENASLTAAILRPKPDQRWLLVTSAYHMPRAMGVFEKAGFAVTAYPVAPRTRGPTEETPAERDPTRNMRYVEIAMREWIGLAAYWLTGRIDHLFPGPEDAAASGR